MIKGFIIGLVVMYVISFMGMDEFNELFWLYTPLVCFLREIGCVLKFFKALIHIDSYWYLYKHCGYNPFKIKATDLINLPKEDKEYLYNHARLKSVKTCWKNILDKNKKVR